MVGTDFAFLPYVTVLADLRYNEEVLPLVPHGADEECASTLPAMAQANLPE
jgi:hypothetical protein